MNRVVLVTGASRGLGKSIAECFLKNRDIVYINYRTTPRLVVEDTFKEYENARFIEADISDETSVKRMFNEIKKEEGRIDIVVNNAGIAIDNTLENKTVNDFKEILNTNLIGTFLVCKYTKNLMKKGSIINISSTNGIDTYYPYSMDYDASKAGVISLTNNFANEYAPNIRVNCIAPGWINTEMNKNLDKDYIKDECNKILLERFAKPEEVAKVVFFLASDDAGYINSTVIRVDGGKKC